MKNLFKAIFVIGAVVCLSAGCASDSRDGRRTDINNVANRIEAGADSVYVSSDLDGSEVKTKITLIADGTVRSKPDDGAAVIGKVYKGKTITLLDTENHNGYIKISYNGRVGYISAGCWKEEESLDSTQGSTDETGTSEQRPTGGTESRPQPTSPTMPTAAPTGVPETDETKEQPSQPDTEEPSSDEESSDEESSDEESSGEESSKEQSSEENSEAPEENPEEEEQGEPELEMSLEY